MFFGLLLSPAYDSIIKNTQDKKFFSITQSEFMIDYSPDAFDQYNHCLQDTFDE